MRGDGVEVAYIINLYIMNSRPYIKDRHYVSGVGFSLCSVASSEIVSDGRGGAAAHLFSSLCFAATASGASGFRVE